MEYIISSEVFILLFNFYMFYTMKLCRPFICILFKNISIYLPFTDDDYKRILNLKKENSNNPSKEISIIRSVTLQEYSQKANEEKYINYEFYVIFFLVNVSSFFMNQSKNIIYLSFHNNLIDDYNISNFNILSCYHFISVILLIFNLIKKNLCNKGHSSNFKIFSILFILSFFIILFLHIKAPFLFNIKYDNIKNIINDRLTKIYTQLEKNYNNVNFLKNISISDKGLNIFYSILFALIFSILYKPCSINAYFDYFIIFFFYYRPEYYLSENEKKFISNKKVILSLKLKIILTFLELYMLIEPLFYEPILFNISNKEYSLSIYLIILFNIFIFDLILSVYYYWYLAFIYNKQNYENIIRFNKVPSDKNYNIFNNATNFINRRFWEIFLNFFILTFSPFALFLSISFKSDHIYYLFKNNIISDKNIIFNIKNYFSESCFFYILLAFISSKIFLSYGKLFYLIISNSKVIKELFLIE